MSHRQEEMTQAFRTVITHAQTLLTSRIHYDHDMLNVEPEDLDKHTEKLREAVEDLIDKCTSGLDGSEE